LDNPDIHWISTYGGRFVVLPDAALSSWHGFPDDGRDPLDAASTWAINIRFYLNGFTPTLQTQ